MKRTVYPDWFNKMWLAHLALKTKISGAPNKHLAYKQCKIHKIEEGDAPYIIRCFKNHTGHIRSLRAQGIWAQEHQDFERWLKNMTWASWESPVEVKKESIVDKRNDRSWSEAYRPAKPIEVNPASQEVIDAQIAIIRKTGI